MSSPLGDLECLTAKTEVVLIIPLGEGGEMETLQVRDKFSDRGIPVDKQSSLDLDRLFWAPP